MSEGTNNGRTVIILGAARSGTSVTTGILSVLGLDVGNVRPPDETNPHGYFEDAEVSKLISEIYALAGGTGLNPPAKEKILEQRERVDKKVEQFCQKRSKNKKIWGWKVPGTNLVIELFLPYLVNPHFVIVFRNPLMVAKSLTKRSIGIGKKVTFFQALRLTNFYNSETLGFLEKNPSLPRVFIAYEDIMNDPIKETRRLADFLGLELNEEKKKEINKLVIPRLRIEQEKRKLAAKNLFLVKPVRFLKKSIRNPKKIPHYVALAYKNNFR